MSFTLNIHNHYYAGDQKLNQIMDIVQEIKDEVVKLQATVDLKQEQLFFYMAGAKTAIEALTAQIERLINGQSPATIADLEGILAGLKTVEADVAATAVDPTPVVEEAAGPVENPDAPVDPEIPADPIVPAE